MEIAPARPVVQVVVRPVQVPLPGVQVGPQPVRPQALRTVEPPAARVALLRVKVQGRVPLVPGLPVPAVLPAVLPAVRPQVRPVLTGKARRVVTARA